MAWVTTSWDDASAQDMRLADLLGQYAIQATFYVPLRHPERPVLPPTSVRALARHFEVGAHGLTHARLDALPAPALEREIVEGKRLLEDTLGSPVTSFCYPYGRGSRVARSVLARIGLRYARTGRLFATATGDALMAPTTMQAFTQPLLVYARHGASARLFYALLRRGVRFRDWEHLALEALDWCLEHGGVFHLWGHAWEVDEQGDWARLERVLSAIAARTTAEQRLTNGQLSALGERRWGAVGLEAAQLPPCGGPASTTAGRPPNATRERGA